MKQNLHDSQARSVAGIGRLRGAISPFVESLAMWKELYAYLPATDRRRLGQAVAATVVASLATAFIPIVIGMFVDAVYDEGGLIGLSEATWPLAGLLVAYILINVMDVIRHQKVHTVTTGFEAAGRDKIYAHVLRWPLTRFHAGTDGAIYGRANRSVEGAVRLIKLGSGDLFPAVLVAMFAVVIATVRHGLLGLLMSVVIPTGFGLVAWQIGSQRGIRVSLKHTKERIDGWVSSCLSMIKVIRTSGTETYFDQRVHTEVEDLRRTELRHHVVMSIFDSVKAANEVLWLVTTVVVAIQYNLASTPGELASVILLYAALTKPLRELHRVIDESSEAALQARDLLDDLATDQDESFTDAGTSPDRRNIGLTPAPSAIDFQDVKFRYENGASPDHEHEEGSVRTVLGGVTMSIVSGERVGLVGASGSGKSTILDLLERLHHNYTGDITLHGRDLRTIPRAGMADLMGYVGQKPTLFPGTIRENLIMGRVGLTEADLDAACRKANIYRDIQMLSAGYDSYVAQKGENLSGGQQQRLCIARALLRTPAIMLLDEPTSALDGPSQAVVQRAIDELEGVTMLVVAHRLSTLQTMDRIIVLHQGEIVEDGTYAALAGAEGPFAAMLNSEEWAA